MLVSLVETDNEGNVDFSTVIPLIDGGTEGMKGQARVFLPKISSCYECSLDSLPAQREFAMCTIAQVPRQPEHCVAYALKLLWPRLKTFTSADDFTYLDESGPTPKDPLVPLDTDNMEHMTFLFHRAVERASQFKITGVTFNMTMQVVKNIIPAIAATNALIAGACVNEAIKYLTWCSLNLDNFFMYMGQTGIYSRTFRYERRSNCIVCNAMSKKVKIDPCACFKDLVNILMEDSDL